MEASRNAIALAFQFSTDHSSRPAPRSLAIRRVSEERAPDAAPAVLVQHEQIFQVNAGAREERRVRREEQREAERFAAVFRDQRLRQRPGAEQVLSERSGAAHHRVLQPFVARKCPDQREERRFVSGAGGANGPLGTCFVVRAHQRRDYYTEGWSVCPCRNRGSCCSASQLALAPGPSGLDVITNLCQQAAIQQPKRPCATAERTRYSRRMLMRESLRQLRLDGTALLLALPLTAFLLAACGGDAGGGESPIGEERRAEDSRAPGVTERADPAETSAMAACPWQTDGLLTAVDAELSDRTDCGMVNSGFESNIITGAMDCFENSSIAGTSVEFTIINCVDCWIASTFVSTPQDGILHIFTEYDAYGDAVRESRVESCNGIGYARGDTVRCIAPMRLFACKGAVSDVY